MSVLVFGGAGFVGLNIAEALLQRGHAVTLFDRTDIPAAAQRAFAPYGAKLSAITGDVLDRNAIERAVTPDTDAIVLGAAITAGAERDAADPEAILQVNLLAQTPILLAARRHKVRRVINLSSAGAYGAAAFKHPLLDEELPCDPVSLYAITKFASERVATRLASLWQSDVVNVRLSAVFGPWERATGVRDTLSAPAQIFSALQAKQDAVLARPGVRDWIYAPDVADAIVTLIEAPKVQQNLYNITTGNPWPALQWGELLAARNPGFTCRLAAHGERLTVDLHSDVDRSPLSAARLAHEFGWRAKYGCSDSVAELMAWSARHGWD